MAHIVDDAERLLDDLRFDTAHLAGNSMGGWVALELARRGRARSVCAFSPAGCWPKAQDSNRPAAALRSAMRQTRLGKGLLPIFARSARFRSWAMRLNTAHGERITTSELVEIGEDVLGCTIADDLLGGKEALGLLESGPCPITLVWPETDRVFPVGEYGARAQVLVPGARFLVLKGVGHVPMFDAPELVANTVLETTGAIAPRGTV
jgi:pimeloyl-ACP methyl ester carboxylesterase